MKRLAHYSQHFIRNPRLIKELVGHTSITKKDTVYDIGAGSGVISSVLATRCKNVVAVEAELRTVEILRRNMQKYPNVAVVQGDVLTLPLPKTPYKVFANIPFHISSAIVRHLTEASHPPEAMYFIVQKQFARKLLPESDGFTNQLGMLIGPEFAVRIRRRLLRTDFWPHPNVDTVFLEIIKRGEPLLPSEELPRYHRWVAGCFSDPKLFAKTPLQTIGVTLPIKPSQLTLSQWLSLYRLHHKWQ